MPTQHRAPRQRPSVGIRILVLLLGILAIPSCAKPDPYLSEDGKKGWKAYRRHCTICHNANPFLEGTTSPGGPSIVGSSEELIRMRVISTKYPKGYKPKADTSLMTPLPQAVKEIPYLFAYLKEVRKPK